MSALETLSHYDIQMHPLGLEILSILQFLRNKSFNIIFCWVPSHAGIFGNEIADAIAKYASAFLPRALPYVDIKKFFVSRLFSLWQQKWDVLTNNKLHSVKPSIGLWPILPIRQVDVKLTRLRIGHTRFTHKYLIFGERAPVCPTCHQNFTVHHILIECPSFKSHRVDHFHSSPVVLQDLVTSFPRITYAGFPLPRSESIKYLGIQFTKYNQNGHILRSIRNKALKKINGFKKLGYKRNGRRTKHLITITNNSILSLFFYSSPIINKFSETHLKSCNVIQTTSLRIALGVPIWTPNTILLKLVGQEILSGKIKRLAIQFFIKQIATQPFSALFHTPDRINSQLVEKDAESLRITSRNLNCIPDHIISLPIFPHSNPTVCEIFLKDFYFQNKELPSSIISSDSIECIQSFFPNHLIIATDGSKSHCYTSIAGFSCLQKFCYRIHPLNSVFTAEVLAICQALDELVVPEKDILILSASYSALSFLKNISFHSPKVIQRLAAKIHIRKNRIQKIALLWVPGHSGVSWNEKADSIAKQVSDFSPYIQSPKKVFGHQHE
ncbi:hypothetical protein AVEN_184434-1 [Araneus ventricosus]|uniref:ribonuclease H n=1 Tax=Araneus ventricosus TaxID=182803 RepID=A0A4Y2BFL1_ARAVE|nr:hypothetical protein AVEN_184434-1 [Araneus ventricosus]